MENQLVHLAEFRQILENYQISDTSKKILEKIKLVLMVAPSATGRNTVIRELLKSQQYHFIISDTTRQPRNNNGVLEQDGRDYWFRTEAQILQELHSGEFLEAEIIHNQQVSGISLRELKKAQDDNKIAIDDVDIGGVSHVLQAKPDTIAIVMLPPSFEEWQRRIRTRGKMRAEEYTRRMQTAIKIFKETLSQTQYKFVINDNIENAITQVKQLVQHDVVDPTSQKRARRLAEQLLNETQIAINRATPSQ
jgi:guanylate kinase